MLKRDFFFEFAGMPQSGKTTVMNTIASFLKRSGYSIEAYRGGSRYSPLYNAPIGDLNLSLACNAVNFVINTVGLNKAEYKIYLLDKGLIDRCIFTDTLVDHGKVSKTDAGKIKAFLTLPHLLEKLDGVFIFVTSPETALYREYANKPRQPEGDVMNASFLSTMHSIIMSAEYNPMNTHYNPLGHLKDKVYLAETDHDNEYMERTVMSVLNTIQNRLNLVEVK